MKRLFCLFLSLLFVCSLCPVFSLSASAQEVDGNTVYTHWYISDPQNELTSFENTIISSQSLSSMYIGATIQLSNEVEKNNLFDFELGVAFDTCTISNVEVRFFNSNSTLVDTVNTTIEGNLLSLTNLQFQENIAKIVVIFDIDFPSWTVVNTVYKCNIDNKQYSFEKNMTWLTWSKTNYNTLGLIVDGEYLYYEDGLDVYQLQTGGRAVSCTEKISDTLSYELVMLPPAVTYINFTINTSTTLTAETGMTWDTWINSEYNTYGLVVYDGMVYSSISDSYVLYKANVPVSPNDEIIEGTNYTIRLYVPMSTFYINGVEYEFEDGMTWSEWVASDYNVDGFKIQKMSSGSYYVPYTKNSYRIFKATGSGGYGAVYSTTQIVEGQEYGTQSYCQGLTAISTFATVQYEFDFSITSVTVNVTSEAGLLNGIIAWLKQIKKDIGSIPEKVGSAIGGVLKDLFIPNSERLSDMIRYHLGDYSSKFGVLSESVTIIDNLASAFVYTETQDTVHLPLVEVDLAGVTYSFGGIEVKVIPDGFEGIVETLKLVVNILATSSFVFAMKKRFKEVLAN